MSLRLAKELQRLEEAGLLTSRESDVLEVEFEGPEGVPPFAGRKFRLNIELSPRFPFEPPLTRLLTPVRHPNIDDQGKICMDLLKLPPAGLWRPTVDLVSVVLAIRQLLGEPNLDSPLMPSIARLYIEDHAAYCRQ